MVAVSHGRVKVSVAEDHVAREELGPDELIDHLSVARDVQEELGHVRHSQEARIPGEGPYLLGNLRTEDAAIPSVVHGDSPRSQHLGQPVGKRRLAAAVDSFKINENWLRVHVKIRQLFLWRSKGRAG